MLKDFFKHTSCLQISMKHTILNTILNPIVAMKSRPPLLKSKYLDEHHTMAITSYCLLNTLDWLRQDIL